MKVTKTNKQNKMQTNKSKNKTKPVNHTHLHPLRSADHAGMGPLEHR